MIDPRSNEDIMQGALAEWYHDDDRVGDYSVQVDRIVAALAAADRHIVSEGEPDDLDRFVLEQWHSGELHLLAEGWAVIDGQRGRLVLVPSLKWTGPTGHEIPGFAVAAFQPGEPRR